MTIEVREETVRVVRTEFIRVRMEFTCVRTAMPVRHGPRPAKQCEAVRECADCRRNLLKCRCSPGEA